MTPIEFPPGVTNLASKNAKIVNWRESNLVRWDNGTTLRPVGGWEKFNLPPFTDPVRKMHRWADNNSRQYTAYLCEQHCYVEIEGVLTDITPAGGMGAVPASYGGYGDYKYNHNTYGTPRPGDNRMRLYSPIYSMDNWGEDLRVMNSGDGRLLGWSPTDPPGTLLTAVTGAPIGNRSFIVTPERHIMIFGMNNKFDTFGWCDEEDDTNWNFSDILSRAGYFDVSPKSPITAHQLFDNGIIMFTPAMSYMIEYVGLPYVYSYRPIGRVSIPVSPASICETPAGVVWPSIDGWWIFDGTAPRVVQCDIWDFIDKYIDIPNARTYSAIVHVANKGEVWWFWPDLDSGGKNARYSCFDYRSKVWSMGKMSRTCGFVYANDRYPIMSDGPDIWKHESGFLYTGAPELPWIESFNLNPNGGENWFTVNKILPDVAGDFDALRFSMMKSNDRNGYTPETQSPQRTKNGSGYVDIRETARDMRLRIDMVKNSDWETVGPILFDNVVRGKK
jgi:hypothetical protein